MRIVWHVVSCKPLILKRKLHFIQTDNIFSGGCPDSLPQSGKKVLCNFHNNSFPWRRFLLQVFCYYEGKKSPRSIDPCPCSHLLYKNVPIDTDSRVRLSDQLSSDLEILRYLISKWYFSVNFLIFSNQFRSKKPDLAVLLSIGGESVDSDTFRAIVSRWIRIIKSLQINLGEGQVWRSPNNDS